MKNLGHTHDLVVVGAGLSGIATAITAARAGLRVALINDRSVFGGNSSKEIRVPPVGARCCNFAYSKETGLSEELLLENLFSNSNCSPEGWNLVLVNAVKAESNIEVFLNTAVNGVTMEHDGTTITAIEAYTINSETFQSFRAPFFADCSGDGVLGVLAGAPFRSGIESSDEFGESLCLKHAQHFTMGSSVWFSTRDAGEPKPFVRPHWVKRVIEEEDFGRHRAVIAEFKQQLGGFWWLELGGDKDMVHAANEIAEDCHSLVYGVWDFLKNRSAISDQLVNRELDWVGTLPGKRESRRFEGDHILSQTDIEQQRPFGDAVAFGGWGFDHHPKDGFFDRAHPSYHVYHRGPYNIPLRCLYSKKISNLLFAGRNISASHYGLSSTRVMLTCMQLGEGLGMAVAVAKRHNKSIRQLADSPAIEEVQQQLLHFDHHLHAVPYKEARELGWNATVTASSFLNGIGITKSSGSVALNVDRLAQFPLVTKPANGIEVLVDAVSDTHLIFKLWLGPDSGSHYPERELSSGKVFVRRGSAQWVKLPAELNLPRAGWCFLEVAANPDLKWHFDRMASVGFLAYDVRPTDAIRPNPYSRWKLFKSAGAADVWNTEDGTLTAQTKDPLDGMVADAYCLRFADSQDIYSPENVTNPWARPTSLPNLWISKATDFKTPEHVELSWKAAVTASSVMILFDSALDFHVTTLWIKYRRRTIPALVSNYAIDVCDAKGGWREMVAVSGNYQRRRVHHFPPTEIAALRLRISGTHGMPRAQVYSVRVY